MIILCSAEASKRSVAPGMKLSEAKAVCADLQVKEYDARLYSEAQQKLCRELISCSPKVSATEPGLFILDASGLSYLGGEAKLCRIIHKTTAGFGYFDVHVGIADTAFTALVASKFKRRQYYIVPRGGDASFLAPLSIKQLPISVDVQESLHSLGIRSIGQMVALSEDSLVQRFGREGSQAWSLANGLDTREPQLPALEKDFKSTVELGSPIELLHQIQFVLKSMMDRLTKQLKQESLLAEELYIEFFNGDEKFNQRPIKLLRPSSHPKFLLEVIKLSLEALPVQREVTGICLSVSRFCHESWEQTNISDVRSVAENSGFCEMVAAGGQLLLNPSTPARNNVQIASITTFETPDTSGKQQQRLDISALPQSPEQSDNKVLSLTLMLQRFVSRLGDDSVVRSVPNDQHIPDKSGAWLPVAASPAVNPVVPVNVNYANGFAGATALAAGLTLRKCSEAIPVLVEFQGETPCSITYEGGWYTVKEITLPERLSGLWWANPVRRSYYVALLEQRKDRRSAHSQQSDSNMLLVSLVHDHEENGWLIHGFYD